MPKSERQRKRKIRLVGGGFRWNRASTSVQDKSGGLKSMRRALRRELKDRHMTPAKRAALKVRLKQFLAMKDGRP